MKIKKFAKEYIHKILRKLDKNKKPKSFSSHRQLYPSASASTSTPGQNDMDGLEEGPFLPEMSLEDTMDIDEMVRIVIGAERGDGGEDDESAHHPSPDESLDAGEPDQTPASTSSSRAMSDPRARHRNEESGWDPSSHRISIPFKARAKALRGC